MKATVITDASFCPHTKAAGWAAWVRFDGSTRPIRKYGAFRQKVQSALEAEMLAAINGVFIARRIGAATILLQTDCLSVVHMFNGVTKKETIKDVFYKALDQAGVVLDGVSARHVKGHSDVADARSWVNRWCDDKAGSAMRLARRQA